jgi:hypothetical protein
MSVYVNTTQQAFEVETGMHVAEYTLPPEIIVRILLTDGTTTVTVYMSFEAVGIAGVTKLSVRVLVAPDHYTTDCKEFLHILVNSNKGVCSYENAYKAGDMVCRTLKEGIFGNAREICVWLLETTVWNTNLVHRVQMTLGGIAYYDHCVGQGPGLKTTDNSPDDLAFSQQKRMLIRQKIRAFAQDERARIGVYSRNVHQLCFSFGEIPIVTRVLTPELEEANRADVQYPCSKTGLMMTIRLSLEGNESEFAATVASLSTHTGLVSEYSDRLIEGLDAVMVKMATAATAERRLNDETVKKRMAPAAAGRKDQQVAELVAQIEAGKLAEAKKLVKAEKKRVKAEAKAKEQEAAEAEAATKAKDQEAAASAEACLRRACVANLTAWIGVFEFAD